MDDQMDNEESMEDEDDDAESGKEECEHCVDGNCGSCNGGGCSCSHPGLSSGGDDEESDESETVTAEV